MQIMEKKTIKINDNINTVIKDGDEPDGYLMCSSAEILPFYNYKLDNINLKIVVVDSLIYAIFYEQITIGNKIITAGKTTYGELKLMAKSLDVKNEKGFGYFVSLEKYQIFFPIDKYPTDETVISFIREK